MKKNSFAIAKEFFFIYWERFTYTEKRGDLYEGSKMVVLFFNYDIDRDYNRLSTKENDSHCIDGGYTLDKSPASPRGSDLSITRVAGGAFIHDTKTSVAIV